MQFTLLPLALLFASALGSPTELFSRAVGDSCKAPEGTGSCKSTGSCKGISYPTGLCPNDPNDIQCCVEKKCSVPAGSGYCRSVSNNGCSGGAFHAGTSAPWPCPGDNDIQCCVKTTTPPPPPSSGSNVGAKILAKARTQQTPYAWGGGSCKGPTKATDGSSDVGFDCSGLVCYALCQVTGRDLFKEGLRNTHAMYCASESKLKYKKYPFSARKAGDAVFFGGACDCGSSSSIHHVGLVMDDTSKMWNAPNDRINKIVVSTIATFEKPCPSVIRFT